MNKMSTQQLMTPRQCAIQPTQLFQFSKDAKKFARQGANVQKWIEALKSEKYTKNKSNALKDEVGYSVLGVARHACDLGPGLSDFRLSEYRALGLSNSVGGCTNLTYNSGTDGFYNSLLELPSDVTFITLGNLIQKHFEIQVRTHRFWMEIMKCNTDLNLFDQALVVEKHVEDNVETWIKALRKNPFQTTGILKQQLYEKPGEDEATGYCCLGLADEVCKLNEECTSTLEHTHADVGLADLRGEFNTPPSCFELFKDITRHTYDCNGLNLAMMNDTYGWTFSMIADFVERQFAIAKLHHQENKLREDQAPNSSETG